MPEWWGLVPRHMVDGLAGWAVVQEFTDEWGEWAGEWGAVGGGCEQVEGSGVHQGAAEWGLV